MDHYHTQAIAASKRGDHKKALEYYDRAVARAQSAKLYDGRAACHEVLQDLPAALKDAKACIRLAPYDPVGYTRAANVLVTMDKKKPAIEVLAFGLRKVKHAGQSFEVLRELHNALMDEVSPRTCVDPMKALPAEVALMVLDYLTFKQLTNVRSVSKGWNKFICGQERLWYNLDLGDARKRVPHSFIVLAIKSSRRKINQALLNRLWDFDKAARLLIANCPIRTLTLQAVPKLSEEFIRTLQPAAQLRHLHISQDEKLTPFMLHKLLDSLHSRLESFSCSEVASTEANNVYSMLEFPRLTHLHRSAAMASGVRLLDNGEANMPALESLIVELGGFGPSYMPIGRLDALKHLKRLVISSAGNDVLNSLCSVMPQGLTTLKLLCVGIHRLPPDFWQMFSMPLLEELDLCVGAPISFQDLRQSLFSDAAAHGTATSLRKLTLQRYAVETTSSEEFTVLCQHRRFCSVQHLGLPFAMGGVEDETMEIISRSCKHITSLDLRDSHVTGVGVKHALSLPSLRELNIVGCPRVGQDAIHWAKGKGLRVLHRAPDALLYERRIRA